MRHLKARVTRRSVLCLSVCKHDYCNRTLSDFNQTCGVCCRCGLHVVVWNAKLPLTSRSRTISQLDIWAHSPTQCRSFENESIQPTVRTCVHPLRMNISARKFSLSDHRRRQCMRIYTHTPIITIVSRYSSNSREMAPSIYTCRQTTSASARRISGKCGMREGDKYPVHHCWK